MDYCESMYLRIRYGAGKDLRLTYWMTRSHSSSVPTAASCVLTAVSACSNQRAIVITTTDRLLTSMQFLRANAAINQRSEGNTQV